jgi:hypothetical protein
MTLNIGNIFLLAEHLDNLSPDEFYMQDCERCISGHANRMSGHRYAEFKNSARWLGITENDIDLLFLPLLSRMPEADAAFVEKAMGHKLMLQGVSAPQAARVLRHLAITGKVDWTVAFAQEPELPKPPALILEEQRR